MNQRQAAVAARFLAGRGFKVRPGAHMVASRPDITLHLNSEGLCWSPNDPSDHILPLIPQLLDVPKEGIRPRPLTSMYFTRRHDTTIARVTTRLEHSSTWKALRSQGISALTPDEHAMVGELLSHSEAATLLTDFPLLQSRLKRIGHRRYFESELPGREASATLRQLEGSGPRSSYLPRTCLVRLEQSSPLGYEEISDALDRAGDWCGYRLEGRKPSN